MVKINKTIIHVLVFLLLIFFAYFIGRDCGCAENYKEIEHKYGEILKTSNKESKVKFKSYKDFYDKWYNKHNCNAMYNNWMHSCQQKEDLFYNKTPQCHKYSKEMARGDPDKTYFF